MTSSSIHLPLSETAVPRDERANQPGTRFRAITIAIALGIGLLHLGATTALRARPVAWEISNLALLAAYLLAALACWERGRSAPGFLRRSWLLVGASAAFWCAGERPTPLRA